MKPNHATKQCNRLIIYSHIHIYEIASMNNNNPANNLTIVQFKSVFHNFAETLNRVIDILIQHVEH